MRTAGDLLSQILRAGCPRSRGGVHVARVPGVLMESTLLIIAAIFVVAVLYSSVGHGGASGYLAVMAFFAVQPEVVRPTSLTLNLFVAGIAAVQYYRAGHFESRLLLPFAAASVPMAFVGGMVQLPTGIYKIVLGVVLIAAAVRLAVDLKGDGDERTFPIWAALLTGGFIGLLSGLVGVGGGIFLTPLLLLMHWAGAKKAAAASAVFIFVNSAAGLAGNYAQAAALSSGVWRWLAAAIAGGLLGSTLGVRRFDSLALRRILAVVLVVAGGKLILT